MKFGSFFRVHGFSFILVFDNVVTLYLNRKLLNGFAATITMKFLQKKYEAVNFLVQDKYHCEKKKAVAK